MTVFRFLCEDGRRRRMEPFQIVVVILCSMGQGQPRSELSMDQLPAALSRSIFLRLAPDSGYRYPAISFGHARDGVEVRARQGRVIHVVQRDVGRNRAPTEVAHGQRVSAPGTRPRDPLGVRPPARRARGRDRVP